jgi:hypothetical protein
MRHERHDFDHDDLAEIWRSAQHRRTEDVYSWFANIFKKRLQLKSSAETRPHYIEADIAVGRQVVRINADLLHYH